MALQLEAYRVAEEELNGKKVDKTAILLLGEDGTFKFCEVFGDINVFLAAKALYLWKEADKFMARIPKEKKGGKKQ